MLTFGSLFAGIGGLDLGMERAGMQCKWQVEIDPFATMVLQKQWPNVVRGTDVRAWPEPAAERVDLICGGFPCQDISSANHRAKGLAGEKSGLWFEYERVIRVMRPRFVVAENVGAITFRGLSRVLTGLSALGFYAEWETVSASAFGAPHGRPRVFIVAYLPGERLAEDGVFHRSPFETTSQKQANRLRSWPGQSKPSPALPDRIRWCPDSQLLRMVDGVPDRLDRYRACGNAVVPEVAEWIGRRIAATCA